MAVGQTFFISLFNDEFQRLLGLNNGQLGGLYAGAMILGSLLVMRLGWIFDRFDLRVCCLLLLALTVASAVALATLQSVALLFAGLFGMRFFGGTMLGLGTQSAMARYFDDDRGRASAVSNAGLTLGFAIFPLIGTQLIAAFGWRGAWWAVAAVTIAMMPVVLVQLTGQGRRHDCYLQKIAAVDALPDDSVSRHFTLREMLRDRRFYLLAPGMLAVPGILFTFQFHQLALVNEKGWSLTAFAAGYSLFAGVSVASNLFVGEVVDRYGSRRMLPFYLLPMIPALFALAFITHPVAIPIYMIGMGLTFGAGLVANTTLWAELFGSRNIGAIRGFVIAMNTIIASIAMALAGWLIDAGVSMSHQALANGMITVAAAALLVAVSRSMPAKSRG
ncbi:MAG: MFS transporter, partial [Rhodospirillaceae bacterium]|nr:MFS transporter [Rhodospirillaceae bacterium]